MEVELGSALMMVESKKRLRKLGKTPQQAWRKETSSAPKAPSKQALQVLKLWQTERSAKPPVSVEMTEIVVDLLILA